MNGLEEASGSGDLRLQESTRIRVTGSVAESMRVLFRHSHIVTHWFIAPNGCSRAEYRTCLRSSRWFRGRHASEGRYARACGWFGFS